MNLPDDTIATARAACLFAAEKYRRITDIANRLNDSNLKNNADMSERAMLEIASGLPTIAEGNAPRVLFALDAMVAELNKQSHNLVTRGALNDAALYEHRLREAYALRRVLVS